MEKLLFRTLKTQEDLELALDKVERYSGVRLSKDYTSRGKVVGAFLNDKLVATYMLVVKPDFRSIMFVPDKDKQANSFFKTDRFEMMEVNGLWIGPSLKKPSMQMRVWLHLIKDIFLARKKYVLLMRDSRNKSMERFFNMSNPQSLFLGSPMLMAGESSHSKIEVSYTTRWSLLFNSHKYLLELRNRQRRLDEFNKNQAYARELKNSNVELA